MQIQIEGGRSVAGGGWVVRCRCKSRETTGREMQIGTRPGGRCRGSRDADPDRGWVVSRWVERASERQSGVGWERASERAGEPFSRARVEQERRPPLHFRLLPSHQKPFTA
ncbi:hypothetical protein ACLOJK_034331 [Asimina triloba]